MAEIEIMPLSERLSDEEIAELAAALEEAGAPRLPRESDEGSATVSDDIDDDLMTEFLDRLEAHDIACDIYLPIEFDGRVSVEDYDVGSAQALVDALDEMRDDLFTDTDEDEEDEDDDDLDMVEEDEEEILQAKLRGLWKLMHAGAVAALERHLPLHVRA